MAMKSKLKNIAAITLMTVIAVSASARPARRDPVVMTQPDGTTIEVTLHGDEFYHWMTSNGVTVAKAPDGFIRPVINPASAQEHALSRASAKRALLQPTTAAHKVSSSSHSLVILVEFSDLQFIEDDPAAAFSALLNEPGYNVNGSIGSAFDYFNENSGGKFNTVFDVVGPVQLDYDMAYYGGNEDGDDKQPVLALVQACQKLDADVDFSQYDTNHDGYVDDVFFFYAGYNEAEGGPSDSIWPHEWSVYSALYFSGNSQENYKFDGVWLGSYACSSEFFGYRNQNMTGIGAFCHEYGHVLGLPDLYDTDYEDNGLAQSMEYFSLMASGCDNSNGRIPPYLSTVEKDILGWMTMPDLLSEPGTYTVEPVQNNDACRLQTDVENEYYVLECRSNERWDSGIGGSGLLIYHVDKSNNKIGRSTASSMWKNWQSYNNLNAYSSHPLCCIVASTNKYNDPSYDGSASKYLFPGDAKAKLFDDTTSPAAVGWSGEPTGHYLSDIAYASKKVTFRYFFNPGTLDAIGKKGINAIMNPGKGVYSSDTDFELALRESNNPPASVKWYYDGASVDGPSVTLKKGQHVINAVLKFTDGTTEILEQVIKVN